MQKDFNKRITATIVFAIFHFAIKDIFKNILILQKMYFPEQIFNFLKYTSYEYGVMIGRCTPLQFKCSVFIVLLAIFLSFAVYYTIVWVMNYVFHR